MKKVFLAMALVVGMTAIAQEKLTEIPVPQSQKVTIEQRNELYIKRMQLDLDLNEKQVADLKKISAAQIQKREERKNQSADKTFANQSQMLDEQITQKAEIKKILTPEQYEKWDKMQSERKEKMKEMYNKK